MVASLQSAGFTLLAFALVISVVVFFHELGHLLVGKWVGVKALKFSIGFGPKLVGFTLGETEYRLSALPLGGYVKFAGDNPYEEIAPEDRGRGFLEAPPWKRGVIAFAGPAANFVLAFALAIFLGMAPREDLAAHIGAVAVESPAARAGLLAGDRVVAIDGEPIESWTEMQERIRAHVGQPLDLDLDRKGQRVQIRVTPAIRSEQNPIETVKYGRLGIQPYPRKAEIALKAPDDSGLRTFDTITSVNGARVGTYEELIEKLQQGPAQVQALRRIAVDAPGGTLWRDEVVNGTLSGPQNLEFTDLSLFAVQPGSAAAEAGLQRGDRVLALDGKRVLNWQDDVLEPLRELKDAPVAFTVRRDGHELQLTVRQHLKQGRDDTGARAAIPELGAAPSIALSDAPRIHVGWNFGGARRGVQMAQLNIRMQVMGIARIASGHISSEVIGGPLMIADVARQAVEAGWFVLLTTIMMISIALGVMNLLPVPVLDGFHVLSALIEGVRRRPLSLRFREVANLVGIALLLCLMLFAFRNDAMRKWFQ